MNKQEIRAGIERNLKVKYGKTLDKAVDYEIFNALSLVLLENIVDDWNATTELYSNGKKAS